MVAVLFCTGEGKGKVKLEVKLEVETRVVGIWN